MVNNNFLLLLSAAFCADYGLCCAFTLCLCVAVLPVIVFSIYQSVVAMDMQSEKEIKHDKLATRAKILAS